MIQLALISSLWLLGIDSESREQHYPTGPTCSGAEADKLDPMSPDEVLAGLRAFYAKTARPDGSFAPGIDERYRGISDSAYSDLAPATYAVTIHRTFGWTLPHEPETVEFLCSRQRED